MTVCPVCHLVGPCDCDGVGAARQAHRPVRRSRRRLALPAPRAGTPRWAGHDRAPEPSGTTCPLDHGEQAAPTLDGGRYICPRCSGVLRGLLTDLPGLMGDLETALTKQARFTARVGARNTSQALAFGYAASEAGWVARSTLLVWTAWVCEVRGHQVPGSWPAIEAYLTEASWWLAMHPTGPQAVAELTAALRQARRTIDRPQDRRFIGRCGAETQTTDGPTQCSQLLYAPVGSDEVRCPRCSATWKVQERQERMLLELRDLVLNATDLARAVDGLGIDVTPNRVRLWKHKKLLAQAVDEDGKPQADAKGRPLYRVGDVLDVVERQAREAAEPKPAPGGEPADMPESAPKVVPADEPGHAEQSCVVQT